MWTWRWRCCVAASRWASARSVRSKSETTDGPVAVRQRGERRRAMTTATIQITAGLMRAKHLASRMLEVDVTKATEKAIYVEGYATVKASDWCFRCGASLENNVSRFVGY